MSSFHRFRQRNARHTPSAAASCPRGEAARSCRLTIQLLIAALALQLVDGRFHAAIAPPTNRRQGTTTDAASRASTGRLIPRGHERLWPREFRTSLLASAGSSSVQPRKPRAIRVKPLPPDAAERKASRASATRHLFSGAVAGAVSNTVVAPLDILRLNIIVSSERQNPVEVARGIFARGGVRAFWHGNSADVARTIPASAIRFYTFALYKTQLKAAMPDLPPAAVSLAAGGLAGMTAMAACFPLETVRTRMATVGAAQGYTLLGYMRQVVVKEGVRALYRGLTPSLISVIPYFAMRFGTYDILLRWVSTINGDDGMNPQTTAFCGMAAGLVASTTTFPFELVRRRAMVGQSERNPLTAMLRIAKSEGVFRGLYKGYGLSIIKVAPSSAVTFLVYESVLALLSARQTRFDAEQAAVPTPLEEDPVLSPAAVPEEP